MGRGTGFARARGVLRNRGNDGGCTRQRVRESGGGVRDKRGGERSRGGAVTARVMAWRCGYGTSLCMAVKESRKWEKGEKSGGYRIPTRRVGLGLEVIEKMERRVEVIRKKKWRLSKKCLSCARKKFTK
jgi:hypothetical protein